MSTREIRGSKPLHPSPFSPHLLSSLSQHAPGSAEPQLGVLRSRPSQQARDREAPYPPLSPQPLPNPPAHLTSRHHPRAQRGPNVIAWGIAPGKHQQKPQALKGRHNPFTDPHQRRTDFPVRFPKPQTKNPTLAPRSTNPADPPASPLTPEFQDPIAGLIPITPPHRPRHRAGHRRE